jgi:hypothetical protein
LGGQPPSSSRMVLRAPSQRDGPQGDAPAALPLSKPLGLGLPSSSPLVLGLSNPKPQEDEGESRWEFRDPRASPGSRGTAGVRAASDGPPDVAARSVMYCLVCVLPEVRPAGDIGCSMPACFSSTLPSSAANRRTRSIDGTRQAAASSSSSSSDGPELRGPRDDRAVVAAGGCLGAPPAAAVSTGVCLGPSEAGGGEPAGASAFTSWFAAGEGCSRAPAGAATAASWMLEERVQAGKASSEVTWGVSWELRRLATSADWT